jgi:hypothetical protein
LAHQILSGHDGQIRKGTSERAASAAERLGVGTMPVQLALAI